MPTSDDLSPDLQELEEDNANQDDGEATPLGHRPIFTDKSDPPVSALWGRKVDGDLVLAPIFQRRSVWDDTRCSRLVESVLLDIPLPVFYLAENPDGTQEVIDGQQRLNALFRYLEDGYHLHGLKAFPELDGKRFRELERAMQKRIREYPLHTVLFKKESDEELRFEIFERLNMGAVSLNDQELRNCVYRGPYNQLLIELSENDDYMWLMGLSTPERRMRDVEYVLRFAAFYHATYLNYRPPMKQFLNEDMLEYQHLSTKEADKLRKAFKTSVSLIRSLLGRNAFKRYYRGTDENARDGRWETRKFNAALYDVLMWSMAEADKNQVMHRLDALRDAFIALMTENDKFVEAIELSTSSIKMVTRRFDLWRAEKENILASSETQPRLFTHLLKERLYKADPICKLCHNRIQDADDAAVDHVELYWLGGQTDEANARLVHRYCNWARSKKEIAT